MTANCDGPGQINVKVTLLSLAISVALIFSVLLRFVVISIHDDNFLDWPWITKTFVCVFEVEVSQIPFLFQCEVWHHFLSLSGPPSMLIDNYRAERSDGAQTDVDVFDQDITLSWSRLFVQFLLCRKWNVCFSVQFWQNSCLAN